MIEINEETMNALMVFAGVALGGGIGSVLRMLVGQWRGKTSTVGILLANTFASAIVAYVVVWDHDWHWAAISAGFAGGLSTFSTWAAQTAELWAADKRTDAINNALLNLLLPVFAVVAVLLPRLFGAF
jgi:CrcB protein